MYTCKSWLKAVHQLKVPFQQSALEVLYVLFKCLYFDLFRFTYFVATRKMHPGKNNKSKRLYTRNQIKLDDSKMEVFFLINDISTNSTSNLTTKDSFEIYSSWGFQNCFWLPDLLKISRRFEGLKRRLPFLNHLV